MYVILVEFGLFYVYFKNVEIVVEKILVEIFEVDYVECEDFCNVIIFIIDFKDVKDFDDVFFICFIKLGLWEVGVYIVDVIYYVKEGGVIDKEVEKCVIFVYLVDCIIFMLFEWLCNFICFFCFDEEKLVFFVIFNMNEKGEVKDLCIVYIIIKSDCCFIYEEV